MKSMVRSAIAAAALIGCGGPPIPPTPVEVAPPPRPVVRAPALKTTQELGTIDESATKKIFQKLGSKFQGCQSAALGRVEYLSGEVKFFLRIGENGRVKYGYLERSTLGDRAAEQCLLDAAIGAAWPAPDGGEAEVRYDGLGFDPASSVRMPTEWPSDRVAGVVGKNSDAFSSCLRDTAGAKFTVTAYIAPGGEVQSVGVATSTKEGATKIECIVKVAQSIKMPNPGSWAAKVAFQL